MKMATEVTNMPLFKGINLNSDAAVELGIANWFGQRSGTVYEGWTGLDFKRELTRHKDLEKMWGKKEGIDFSQAAMFEKVIDTTGASDLIPVYLDPGLIDLTRQNTPFISLLKRETMIGLTANIQQITAKNTAVWLAESGTYTTQDETYGRAPVTVKYGYSIGEVTGQTRAATRTYVDSMQTNTQIHGLALRELEEFTALCGSNTATPGDPCVEAAEGYDGIFKGIREVTGTYGNETDLAGGATITLTNVTDSITKARENKGKPSLIVTDLSTYNSLKRQIQDWERHVDQTEIAWGMTSYTIDGIPVIWTHSIPTTTDEKAVVVCDMEVLCMKVLQDITYEDLAKVGDSDKYMMKVYEVFCDKSAGKFHASIVGGV